MSGLSGRIQYGRTIGAGLAPNTPGCSRHQHGLPIDEKKGLTVRAYVIMSNHVHTILHTEELVPALYNLAAFIGDVEQRFYIPHSKTLPGFWKPGMFSGAYRSAFHSSSSSYGRLNEHFII